MNRTRIVLSALVVGLLAWGGVAMARTGTAAAELESTGGTTVYSVEEAGTVTVSFDGTALVLVDFQAADGWSATVDSRTPIEIEIDFLSSDRHLRFKAEVEDEGVRAEVEDRTETGLDSDGVSDISDDDSPDDESTGDDSPDGGSVDDRSGSNSGSDDDRSGSNSGSSNDDSFGDDRSGSNSGSGSGDGRTESHTNLIVGVQTVAVPGHGSITVDVAANVVTFVSAEGTGGWTATLDEANGHEVKVLFQRDGVVVEGKLEIEGGRLRLRVELED